MMWKDSPSKKSGREMVAGAEQQRPLELSIMSAQDLKNVSKFGKKMKTYAVAWVYPSNKAATHVDAEGGNNPTWNDKLTLSVDKNLFVEDTAAITIDIYSRGALRDKLIGTVRILLADAVKGREQHRQNFTCMPFLIRRPSGRPQGILNICIPRTGLYPHKFDYLADA